MTTKYTILSLLLTLSFNIAYTQQTITQTMNHDGLNRSYIIYVPEIYDDSTPTPLLFNFHGFTGLASIHVNSTGMKSIADTAGFILVAPQGSLFFGSSHWNVGAWTVGTSADDLGFTDAMIDTLAAQYNIDLDRVYSCGFSNGGYFSYELACQLSDRIAAIGSVGGKMSSETFNACNPQHPTPVVSIHGTADNVVTYNTTQPSGSKTIPQTNAYWINFNNTDSDPILENVPNINTLDGSTVEYFSYKNGDNCVAVDHYKVNGGGHDWPGSWGNMDINSSTVIWNFVSQYDINGLINCAITSTEEAAEIKSDIILFPNPTSGLVTVDSQLKEETEVQIFAPTGKLLLSEYLAPGDRTIDVTQLPPNIYYLKIGLTTLKLVKI